MKTTKTIDLTPTWEGILPILLKLLENKSSTPREFAIAELTRMARIADRADIPSGYPINV